MDISKGLNGRCVLGCEWIRESTEVDGQTDDGPKHDIQTRCITLYIPILFTDVSTVDQGINQVSIEKAEMAEIGEVAKISRVRIHPYNEDNQGGTTINDRPVTFRKVDGDNNPLTFSVGICIPDSVLTEEISQTDTKAFFDGKEIELVLVINLVNLANLKLIITVKPNLTANELQVLGINKVFSSKTAVANMLLLAAGFTVTGLWSFYFNRNIHLQDPILDRISSGLLGAGLAFLGLSITSIKKWSKTLTTLLGLLKFPEFHLPVSTISVLRSKSFTFLLLSLMLGSLVLIYLEWSVTLPKSEKHRYIIYDTVKNTYLESNIKRVYFEHFDVPGRFRVLCFNGRHLPNVEKKYFLGEIVRQEGMWGFFKAGYQEYSKKVLSINPNSETEFKFSRIEDHDMDSQTIRTIRNAYCNQKSDAASITEDTIIIIKNQEITSEELTNKSIKVHQLNLLQKNVEYIRKNREKVNKDIENAFKKQLRHKQIKGSVLIETTRNIIELNQSRKKHPSENEVKAYALLRGLWAHAGDINTEISEKQINQVAELVNNRISLFYYPQSDNKDIAVIWEFLFEIENSFQDKCGLLIHQASIGKLHSDKDWISKQHMSAIARLLRTSLKMGVINPTMTGPTQRRQFFENFVIDLPNIIGSQPSPKDYFLNYFNYIKEPLSGGEVEVFNSLF